MTLAATIRGGGCEGSSRFSRASNSATSGSAALGNGNPQGYVERQTVYAVIGVVLLLVVSRLDLERLRALAPTLVLTAPALCLGLPAVGSPTPRLPAQCPQQLRLAWLVARRADRAEATQQTVEARRCLASTSASARSGTRFPATKATRDGTYRLSSPRQSPVGHLYAVTAMV